MKLKVTAHLEDKSRWSDKNVPQYYGAIMQARARINGNYIELDGNYRIKGYGDDDDNIWWETIYQRFNFPTEEETIETMLNVAHRWIKELDTGPVLDV